MEYKQKKTSVTEELNPGEQREYYWYKATDAKQELIVRNKNDSWNWSGSFKLDEVNDFGLRIRNSQKSLFMIQSIVISHKVIFIFII